MKMTEQKREIETAKTRKALPRAKAIKNTKQSQKPLGGKLTGLILVMRTDVGCK